MYPLVAGTFAPTVAPKVTGTGTFTVSAGTWPAATLTDGSFDTSYQWYAGNNPEGPDGPTYTPSLGTDPVWVKVTVTRDGYTPLTYRLVARRGP